MRDSLCLQLEEVIQEKERLLLEKDTLLSVSQDSAAAKISNEQGATSQTQRKAMVCDLLLVPVPFVVPVLVPFYIFFNLDCVC